LVDYIILANYDNSLVKRFRVLQSGYQPVIRKTNVIRETVTGKIDNQVGPILLRWEFVIRAYAVDPTDQTQTDPDTSGYGTLAHLKSLFSGNNTPPNNQLTFTDFDGTSYTVYLVGELSERPLSPFLDGACAAVFDVPITIVAAEALA
jgi:hypothetical protein